MDCAIPYNCMDLQFHDQMKQTELSQVNNKIIFFEKKKK